MTQYTLYLWQKNWNLQKLHKPWIGMTHSIVSLLSMNTDNPQLMKGLGTERSFVSQNVQKSSLDYGDRLYNYPTRVAMVHV